MVFELIIKPIVFLDIEEPVIYYSKISEDLAKRFYKSFLLSLHEIQLHPSNYRFVSKTVRRHIINSFPYKIFYIIEQNKVIIIGVAHAKRSNSFIKSNLKYR